MGATGTFQTSTDGSITFYLPTAYQKEYLCIFRVTDDDDVSSLDTVIVTVSSWETVGDFSDVEVNSSSGVFYNKGNMSVHITNSGIPLVAYDVVDTINFKIFQYSGSGTSWSDLNFSSSNPRNQRWIPIVRVNNNSEIYFTFTRFFITSPGPFGPGYEYHLECLKFNTNTWELLGDVDLKEHRYDYDEEFDKYRLLNSFAFDNVGNPLILTNRNLENNMYLKRYTGSNWEPLGIDSVSKVITSDSSDFLLTEYSNGIPYVAYRDRSNSNYIRVLQFNGSTFELLGSSPSPTGGVSFLSFDVHDGTPYVAYIEAAFQGEITVKKYTAGSWSTLGGSASPGDADYPSLEIDENGSVFIAYRDRTQNSMPVVRRFNGTTWVPLDGNEIVENVICDDQMKLCIRNDRIYLMFLNSSDHIIIKEYFH